MVSFFHDIQHLSDTITASILYKSIVGHYRPVSYPDGPITARYRFIKNAYWDGRAVFRDCSISRASSYYLFIYLQSNLSSSNTDSSLTTANSNSFFSPYEIRQVAQENRYLMIFFFLFYHGIVCCEYSFESPHRGDSNEDTQHTIIV